MQAVLITRGSRGMALFQRKQVTSHIPIFGSDEVTDVTGAGDTVIATFGAGARRGRVVLRSRAAGQLRRRSRRDEAGHSHRVRQRAERRGDEIMTSLSRKRVTITKTGASRGHSRRNAEFAETPRNLLGQLLCSAASAVLR